MRLEDIGFYTLSDQRALNVSLGTPLKRCELILTDACNFKCPYCRGLRKDIAGTIPYHTASKIIEYWTKDKLENIRFSGGEPTLYKRLPDLVLQAKSGGVKRIAVSTNGSANLSKYEELIKAGVNDFSISLDGGCYTIGDKMSGGITGMWDKVVKNIKEISKQSYCSVGMVFTEDNIDNCIDSVMFADSLNVSDIRVIPSAQYNKALSKLSKLPKQILDKYPILKYRINNILNGRHVRGIKKVDKHKCWLVLDDMAIAGDYHFPCIIYLREGGDPIGKVGAGMRRERLGWIKKHNPYKDPICKKNCLDVCIDYNNCAESTHSLTNTGELWVS
jgi:molybdenum cofactor biosynthesis enzyme MoaA